ncbi:MAG: tetraacyldisaccharide 4'-kinase [Candidatus Omnitrophota bacterium]|nr:MAG: tetraacyldisaccharide 4'-kinase [Candidatus Omnitrophota bacterium]
MADLFKKNIDLNICLPLKEHIKKYLADIESSKKRDFLSKVLKSILFCLSFLYSIILEARLFVYNAGFFKLYRSNVRVISVGNITVGGTGKTPLVALIAQYLIKAGYNVAVVTRGYAALRSASGFLADEAEMLKQQLPGLKVEINRDRAKGINSVREKYNCACVILDDAFQNLKIYKGLNIVCIDCRNAFGNKLLLPAGIMRVPFSYLKLADVFVLTHSDSGDKYIRSIYEKLRNFNRSALICRSVHMPQCFYNFKDNEEFVLSKIRGKKIAALCGIANPQSFENMLHNLGADIALKFYFPDHYFYQDKELANIFKSCAENFVSVLVTTAKDAPRLKTVLKNNYNGPEILILKIQLQIKENEEKFMERISCLLAA